VISVLPRSAFRCNNSTTVNFFEVAVGEFVFSLVLLIPLVINPQVPFGVFVNPVQADELILLLCGRLVFAPRALSSQTNFPSFTSSLA
jgi:hypothetical protein